MRKIRTRRSFSEMGSNFHRNQELNIDSKIIKIGEIHSMGTNESYTSSPVPQLIQNGRIRDNGLRRLPAPKVKHGHAYFRSMEARYNLEEFESEVDPEGEKKVDKNGNLIGDREYKVRCFNLPRDPQKLFALSGDVSKALQFRDTYVLYLKNPNLARIMATPEDREYMKNNNILPAILRNRSVSITTARSIFREFGHKCIKKGRVEVDDYWVSDPSNIIQIDPPMMNLHETSSPEERSPIFDFNQPQGIEEEPSSDKQQHSFQFPAISSSSLFSRKQTDNSCAQQEGSKIIAVLSINNPKMFRTVASSLAFNKLLLESRRKLYASLETNCKQYPVRISKSLHTLPITSFKPLNKERTSLLSQELVQNCIYNPLKAARIFQDKLFNDTIPPNEAFPIAIMPNQCEYPSTA